MLNRAYGNLGLRLALVLGGSQTLKREEGQTMVEYALIIATIGIGVTAAMVFLRDQLQAVFTAIGNAI